MQVESSAGFGRLLMRARAGDAAARGTVFARYGDYLHLLARLNIGQALQPKVSRSDVVQETFLQAQRDFEAFRGTTEREWMAWLRRILARQIAQNIRHHHRERRDIRMECRLADALDRSSAALAVRVADTAPSPTLQAVRHEQEVLLADALAKIKPSHREAIILRNLEELSFEEVARRIGCSTVAAKSLWVRALSSLRQVLRHIDDTSVR